MRLLRSLILLLLFGLLAGCNLRGQFARPTVPPLTWTPSFTLSPTPLVETNLPETGTPSSETGTPSPVATQTLTRTATSSPTPSPTVTLTPTITLTPRPSRTPTNTPTITSTPTLNPKANLLRIAVPGPMSKVISPIEFVFYISPDFVGNTRIELIGEDGRELYTKSFRTFATEGSTKVSEEIDFEIPGTAEVARLQVSTFDKFGQRLAVNSVRLLLLSIGETQLNPPMPPLEHVLLRTPKWAEEISGGLINIQGEIQPVNTRPITVELFDQLGNLLTSQLLPFDPARTDYQPFNMTVSYRVETTKVPARLVIRQDDDRIGGVAYFYSRELILNP